MAANADGPDALAVERLHQAVRAAHAGGDLAAAKLLKDRLVWALYYDRLGYHAKARILYFRALNDLIRAIERDVPPADAPACAARLRELNESLMNRMATLERDLRDDILLGNTPPVAEIIRALDRPAAASAATPVPAPTPAPAPDMPAPPGKARLLLLQKVNRIVRVPALMLGSGLRTFVQGGAAVQFQSTFRRKASVRRAVLGSQLDLTAAAQSLRRVVLARATARSSNTMDAKDVLDLRPPVHASPQAAALMYEALARLRALWLMERPGSPQSPTEANALPAHALQAYHAVAFAVIFPLRTAGTSRSASALAPADALALVLFLGAALGASSSQKAFLAQVADSAKADKYNDALLLDDLRQQLARVPVHPFYGPTAFAAPEHHQQWLRAERHRLQELIASYSPAPDSTSPKAGKTAAALPPPIKQAARELDHHATYLLLAHMLWEQFWHLQLAKNATASTKFGELFVPTLQHDADDAAAHPLDAYSAKIAGVLRLVAERFGVGDAFQMLARVSVLAALWRRSSALAATLAVHLADLERLTASAHPTKTERAWHERLLALMHDEVHAMVSGFKLLEPAYEDLLNAVALLRLTCPRGASLQKLLQAAVRTSTERFCDQLRVVTLATRPAVEPNVDFLTTEQLLAYTEALLDESASDREVYQHAFSPDTAYLSVVRETVLMRLTIELKALKSALVSNRVREDAGTALDLLITLNGLGDALECDLKSLFDPKLGLTAVFREPVLGWIVKSRELLKGWIDNAVGLDVWEPVAETEPYSTSVVDVFSMLSEILEYYGNFARLEEQLQRPETILHALVPVLVDSLDQFTDLVLQAARRQLDALDRLAKQEWHQRPKREGKRAMPSMRNLLRNLRRSLPGRSAWTLLKLKRRAKSSGDKDNSWSDWICLLCISANNCEMARMLLQDVLAQFETEHPPPDFRAPVLAAGMQSAFAFAKAKGGQIIDGVVALLSTAVTVLVAAIVQRGFEKETCLDLFDFMNQQLSLFAENLYPQVLARFLKRFAASVLGELDRQLSRPLSPSSSFSSSPPPPPAAELASFLDSLRGFFHADGDGVPLATLDAQFAALQGRRAG